MTCAESVTPPWIMVGRRRDQPTACAGGANISQFAGVRMTQLSMYDASVPVFVRQLKALSVCLDKAAAHCAAKKLDETVLTGQRLIADMFPLSRQVQIATDFAKGTTARLAGQEPPAWDDTEKTIPELKARIQKAIDYVSAIGADKINGSEMRDVTIKLRGAAVMFKGQPYLLMWSLPNFYFHVSAAYAILRANGVELGKGDFMGPMPGA